MAPALPDMIATAGSATFNPRPSARPVRAAPALSHYRLTQASTPSQQAADGALEIYLEGWDDDNELQMLFGLSVLQSAQAVQVESAIATAAERRGETIAEIHARLGSLGRTDGEGGR